MYNIKITAMILLMLRHLIDFLQQMRFEGSTVRLKKDGSMSNVIPFEGLGGAIQDPIDDNLITLLQYGKSCLDCGIDLEP